MKIFFFKETAYIPMRYTVRKEMAEGWRCEYGNR